MERQLDYVMRTVEERGVRFVRLWFTDVLGFLKSVEITPAERATIERAVTPVAVESAEEESSPTQCPSGVRSASKASRAM